MYSEIIRPIRVNNSLKQILSTHTIYKNNYFYPVIKNLVTNRKEHLKSPNKNGKNSLRPEIVTHCMFVKLAHFNLVYG